MTEKDKEKDDFLYIVRMAGKDLDGERMQGRLIDLIFDYSKYR